MDRDDLVKLILESTGIIAIAGLSPDPGRTSHHVGAYLLRQGYRIIPVTPSHESVLGIQAYPRYSMIERNVPDLLLIFRRSEHVYPIVEDALSDRLRLPKFIWLQDGITCSKSAELAAARNIPIIMDDCIMRQHLYHRG